jgi:hypothetical protein
VETCSQLGTKMETLTFAARAREKRIKRVDRAVRRAALDAMKNMGKKIKSIIYNGSYCLRERFIVYEKDGLWYLRVL